MAAISPILPLSPITPISRPCEAVCGLISGGWSHEEGRDNPLIPFLLDTLGIQEAKDSSEIENIITTHDKLYAFQDDSGTTAAAKEVRHYVSALRTGYEAVRDSGLIRLETVLAVQAELEQTRAGLRMLPGTVLKNEATGQTI